MGNKRIIFFRKQMPELRYYIHTYNKRIRLLQTQRGGMQRKAHRKRKIKAAKGEEKKKIIPRKEKKTYSKTNKNATITKLLCEYIVTRFCSQEWTNLNNDFIFA